MDPVARTGSTLNMRFAVNFTRSLAPRWKVRQDLLDLRVTILGQKMKDRRADLQTEIEESIACSLNSFTEAGSKDQTASDHSGRESWTEVQPGLALRDLQLEYSVSA